MEEALKPEKKITGGLGTRVATTHPRAAALSSAPQAQGQTAGGLQGRREPAHSSLELTSVCVFSVNRS